MPGESLKVLSDRVPLPCTVKTVARLATRWRHASGRCLWSWIGAASILFPLLASAKELPNPDSANLPPRTLIASPATRPVPTWLQTNLRIGHLPGYNERMVKSFLKAGYNVVSVNCLDAWHQVGPSAEIYPASEVKRLR